MYVVIRAARNAPDRRMSCAIVAARTSHLPWRRSNLVPRVSPSLLAHRGVPLAHRPWNCRCLGAPGTPPLARTRALPSLALWIESRRRRPGNHRHRMSRSGSRGHRSHWPGVHCRARYRATAVANESRWGVKNWTLALRIFFYRCLDLVRLDRIALSGLGFL
jgi:hypothetical protein